MWVCCRVWLGHASSHGGATGDVRECSHMPASPPSVMSCRYDGQVFVKPPEVLARDRLLGTYEVKPVLARLR